jgi:hypothetical protein
VKKIEKKLESGVGSTSKEASLQWWPCEQGEAYGSMVFYLSWRRRLRITSVEQFSLVIVGIYEQFPVLIVRI